MKLYYILFSTLIFLFSLGHLGRISFLRQEVNVYLYEVILVILTLILFLRYKLRPFETGKRLYKSVLLFAGYLFLSYLISTPNFSMQSNVIGLLYLLRLSGYLLFFIYLLYFIHRKSTDKKFGSFLNFLTVAFFGLTVGTSIGQYALYPDIRNLLYAGWDPHLSRMVGVFLEPSVSGAIYGLLFFYFIMQSKYLYPFKILAITVLFILILLTYSRGTYLGFISTLFFIFIRYLKIKRVNIIYFFLLFVIGLFTVSQLPGEGAHLTRTSTIASRVANYQEAIRIWSKNPIFGVGYNHIRYVRDIKPAAEAVEDVSHAEASFHSSFLIVLVSGGIIGLLLFIYMLYELSLISRYSLYAVLFLSLSSLTDNVFLHPFVLFFFIFMITLFVSHLSDRSR